jgi:hypothetical protein
LIHIERSDGMPPVKTFIAVAGDDENTRDCDGVFLGNEVYLGQCDDGESIISGFRFDGVEIPNGATIKYAFITFSVDGEYTNPINLKIYGEDIGDSEPFTEPPTLDNRPTTSEENAVLWNITDTWNLTDNHAGWGDSSKYSFTTPQLAGVIQEIVGRYDWQPGNALSIIIKNNGSATHRRVIAWERANSDPKLFPARLIIAYEGGNPAPTSTPTATATPTSTPTLTPSPTPVPTNTPEPTATSAPTNTPAPTSPPWWQEAEMALMQDEPVQQKEAFSNLLSAIRDQVLKTSPKGDAYIDVIYQHAPEIMALFLKDEDIRQQTKALTLEVQPMLSAILSDRAESSKPHVTKAWIDDVNDLLTIVKEQVSPELRAEIEWWQVYLPDFVGKTGIEIWEMLPER